MGCAGLHSSNAALGVLVLLLETLAAQRRCLTTQLKHRPCKAIVSFADVQQPMNG